MFLNYGPVEAQKKFTVQIIDDSKLLDSMGCAEAYFLPAFKAVSNMNEVSASKDTFFFSGETKYPTPLRIYSLNDNFKINELLFIEEGEQTFHIKNNLGKYKITGAFKY